MMYCEKALQLLTNLERLDEDTTDDLACCVMPSLRKHEEKPRLESG